MSITQKIEKLLEENQAQKAERLFEIYFSVTPQQAKQHLSNFQVEGQWQLPPVPQSLMEIEAQVQNLWRESYILIAIEFYRLHTGCSLKESSQRVQQLCEDIPMEED